MVKCNSFPVFLRNFWQYHEQKKLQTFSLPHVEKRFEHLKRKERSSKTFLTLAEKTFYFTLFFMETRMISEALLSSLRHLFLQLFSLRKRKHLHLLSGILELFALFCIELIQNMQFILLTIFFSLIFLQVRCRHELTASY